MALTIEGSRALSQVPSPSAAKLAETTPKTPAAQEEHPFAKVLHGLAGNLERGERTMANVRNSGGSELGATELLALQAEVYRYSEAVDLSAKLVDRTTNGVKTVLQGQ
jgi:hypothetical protein